MFKYFEHAELVGIKPKEIFHNTTLTRSKMDPNRDEEDGAQGRPEAVKAYNEFHNKIAQVQ